MLWGVQSGPGDLPDHWLMPEAYVSRSQCLQGLLAMLSLNSSDPSSSITSKSTVEGVNALGSGSVGGNTNDGRHWRANYRCLPDTVDPRGPKGK